MAVKVRIIPKKTEQGEEEDNNGYDPETGNETEKIVKKIYKKGWKSVRKPTKTVAENRPEKMEKAIKDKGCPDLLAESGDRTKFIEVKSPNDGLRLSQAKWIAKYGEVFSIDLVYLDDKYEEEISFPMEFDFLLDELDGLTEILDLEGEFSDLKAEVSYWKRRLKDRMVKTLGKIDERVSDLESDLDKPKGNGERAKCPECGYKAAVPRKTKEPKYKCYECGHIFDL